ncbi:MAG: S8 family serine peptidase [Flavobacterium sp.]
MKAFLVLSASLFLLMSCKLPSSIAHANLNLNKYKEVSIFNNLDSVNWFQKNNDERGYSGMFLDKLKNGQGKKIHDIIVAVIDSPFDINHDFLKHKIWINKAEIPKNGIDDDDNGYIDDTNGWNFIGTKDGGYMVWDNFEYVRVLGKTQNRTNKPPIFNCRNEEQEYKRAKSKFIQDSIYYENWYKSLVYSVKMYPIAKDSLKHYFPNESYSYKQLDSMYVKYKINDKTFRQRRLDNDLDIGAMIAFMKARLDFGEKSLEDVKENQQEVDSIINKCLNLDFDGRLLIKSNSSKFGKTFGNNTISVNVSSKKSTQNHATKVSGIVSMIARESIKIMPLVISANGDEHDKDIAMAIHYAVDNGAKVINMSFGKEFSMHKKWVIDALKYAEKNNVLLVHAAGNDQFDIDRNPFFPNDMDYENPDEVVGNFINVGATTAKADSTLVASFSNYGKKNVDLFAPGDKIYTTIAGNSYGYDSGTSLSAPMVSGTAALIWSYYPKLSAKVVKEIILESGTTYDMEVLIPGGEGKKAKFSELSKSGKVLNVYNAMQLAEKVSKNKR